MPGAHHTPPQRGLRIVVGYDGSAEAAAALADAAHRAGPLGELYVVVAFDEPADWMGEPQAQRALDIEQHAARRLVQELEDGFVPQLLETRWEPEIIAGSPADGILRVTRVRDADEIAVGSRGRGRARAALGSVSLEVLHGTDRPVRVMTDKAARRLRERAVAVP
jgi:nucleotide-binding universal stress UspA family protein